MIRYPAAVLLLAAGWIPAANAQAGDNAAVLALVRNAYALYATGNDTGAAEVPMTARLKGARDECSALQEKIEAADGDDSSFGACSEDYDVFCQCQDLGGVQWAKILIQTRFPAPGRGEALIDFQHDGQPDLKLLLAKTPKGWEVDDFWEYAQAADGSEGSYRKRVTASIQEMRAKLKLPAWKEPGL